MNPDSSQEEATLPPSGDVEQESPTPERAAAMAGKSPASQSTWMLVGIAALAGAAVGHLLAKR